MSMSRPHPNLQSLDLGLQQCEKEIALLGIMLFLGCPTVVPKIKLLSMAEHDCVGVTAAQQDRVEVQEVV